MREIKDGGPAFPTDSDNYGSKYSGAGMTLRDAFAISAAGKIWERYQCDGTAQEYDNWREGVAVEAYRLADEMLEARSRKPDSMLRAREAS